MTNEEWIKSLNTYELVTLFSDYCCPAWEVCNDKANRIIGSCEEIINYWLKQEHKENE